MDAHGEETSAAGEEAAEPSGAFPRFRLSTADYVLDQEGEPLECHDSLFWGQWMEEHSPDKESVGLDSRRVGYFERDNVTISTVFLGIPHGWCPTHNRPVLFELQMKHRLSPQVVQERFCSRAEALRRHQVLVEMTVDLFFNNRTELLEEIRERYERDSAFRARVDAEYGPLGRQALYARQRPAGD